MAPPNRSRIFISICVVLLLGFGAMGIVLGYIPSRSIAQLDEGYWRIQKGMSATEVANIMNFNGDWSSVHFGAWWDEEQLDSSENRRIKKAVRYSVSTFFLRVTFEVTFDEDDKVVGHHRYD